MPLTVTCRQCGQAFIVAPHLYGERVACTNCQGVLDIPHPEVPVQANRRADVPRPPGGPAQPLHPSRALRTHAHSAARLDDRTLIVICCIVAGVSVLILVLAMLVSKLVSNAGNRDVAKGQSHAASGDSQRHLLAPEESFTIEMPVGPNWQTLLDGPMPHVADSYSWAVADIERGMQLSVLVLPASDEAPTLDLMKSGWERGFLKNASRKTSSDSIQIGGRDAHRVTGEVDSADGPIEITGILVVAQGRTFTLGITKFGSDATDDPDVIAFVNSFNVRTAAAPK